MSALLLLALMSGGLTLGALDDGDAARDGDSADTPDEPDTTDEPDVGAAFSFDPGANEISVEVGKDETRTLVAVRLTEEFAISGCCASGTDYSMRFFLVDDIDNFPPSAEDVLAANADTLVEGEDFEIEGEDLFLFYDAYWDNVAGAEEVGQVDLGRFSSNTGDDGTEPFVNDTRDTDATLATNAPVTIFEYTNPFGEGDGFTEDNLTEITVDPFLVPERSTDIVTQITGEDGQTETQYDQTGAVVFGSDGDDVVTVLGTGIDATYSIQTLAGDDSITVDASNSYLANTIGVSTVNIDAGDGNDTIDGLGNETNVFGGAGNDQIVLDFDFDGTAVGGDGNDLIIAADGLVTDGATLDGGAGDDQIIINNALDFDITTGEGADLVALGPELRDSLLPITITDFDPNEDALVLALGVDTPDEVALTIFRNLAEDRTEIRAIVPAVEAMTDTEFGVLLYLEGAPEIADDRIAIVNDLPTPAVT